MVLVIIISMIEYIGMETNKLKKRILHTNELIFRINFICTKKVLEEKWKRPLVNLHNLLIFTSIILFVNKCFNFGQVETSFLERNLCVRMNVQVLY